MAIGFFKTTLDLTYKYIIGKGEHIDQFGIYADKPWPRWDIWVSWIKPFLWNFIELSTLDIINYFADHFIDTTYEYVYSMIEPYIEQFFGTKDAKVHDAWLSWLLPFSLHFI